MFVADPEPPSHFLPDFSLAAVTLSCFQPLPSLHCLCHGRAVMVNCPPALTLTLACSVHVHVGWHESHD